MLPSLGAFNARELPLKRGKFTRDRVSAEMLMAELDFDPIRKLIESYQKLTEEVALMEQIREGSLVQLTKSGGVLKYSPRLHFELYDRLIHISEALLRYRYARVSEATIEEGKNKRASLVVQLTQEGDKFVIGNEDKE